MSNLDDILNKKEEHIAEIKNHLNTDKKIFNRNQREEKINDFLLRKKGIKRREKNFIKHGEYDPTTGKTKEIVISLSVIGIVIIFLSSSMFPNDLMFAVLIILGATSFLPIGMILGWMLFDSVMRCKILRKITKKNFGIINFVFDGKVIAKIKDFGGSLIWKDNQCWVIANSRIIQYSTDGNAINQGKQIDSDLLITYVDTVPVLFVDGHSMVPLALSGAKNQEPIFPEEIGSALKGWVDNQRAKMLAVKKFSDQMMIIIGIACIGAVVIALVTMSKVDEMSETIISLKEQLQFLINNMQSIPP